MAKRQRTKPHAMKAFIGGNQHLDWIDASNTVRHLKIYIKELLNG